MKVEVKLCDGCDYLRRIENEMTKKVTYKCGLFCSDKDAPEIIEVDKGEDINIVTPIWCMKNIKVKIRSIKEGELNRLNSEHTIMMDERNNG